LDGGIVLSSSGNKHSNASRTDSVYEFAFDPAKTAP
jgi:hypothetical protein